MLPCSFVWRLLQYSHKVNDLEMVEESAVPPLLTLLRCDVKDNGLASILVRHNKVYIPAETSLSPHPWHQVIVLVPRFSFSLDDPRIPGDGSTPKPSNTSKRMGQVAFLNMIHTTREPKRQNMRNIQQLNFARGHPPNYYAAGKLLKYARADGMACSQFPVVVCGRQIV